jgi:hypothetical protein
LVRDHGGRGAWLGGAAAVAVRPVVESANERAAIAKVQRSDDPAQCIRLRASTSQGLVRKIGTRIEGSPREREARLLSRFVASPPKPLPVCFP